MIFSNTIPAYVYYVKHRPTGQFYHGFRSKNIDLGLMPEEDFWKNYFTSSTEIHKLLESTSIDEFDASIIYKDTNTDEAYWYEQESIKQTITSPLCLNKYYIDRKTAKQKFDQTGETPWNAGLTKETDERLKKSSEKLRGPGNPRYGKKYTEEESKALSIATTGIPKSEETKQKMRKPKTEEHAENISKAALQRPRFECEVCGRMITKANIENHRKTHVTKTV